jgi:GNAT superfamily N-acetyltransferase
VTSDVRLVGPDDVPAVGRSLARAFRDDPIFEWLLPGTDVEQRANRSERFFATDTKIRVKEATAWCSGDRAGAALWAAPDRWRTSVPNGLRLAAAIARSVRWRAPAALASLSRIERAHPKEPHWYLAVLGTDPDHQGRGIGTALIEPVLERCDTEGLASYLESSKESNIPYYERFGWKVQRELPLGPKAPSVWAMWRDPQ